MCSCKFNCTLTAIIASLVAGVATTLLVVTSSLVLTPVILWVFGGIGLAFLLLSYAGAIFNCSRNVCGCCFPFKAVLTGAIGTIIGSAVLLLVDLAATGIVSALLSGVTIFFFILTLTGAACFAKCHAGCSADSD